MRYLSESKADCWREMTASRRILIRDLCGRRVSLNNNHNNCEIRSKCNWLAEMSHRGNEIRSVWVFATPLNRLPSITFLTDAFTVGTGGHQAGMRLKAGYGVSIHRTVNAPDSTTWNLRLRIREGLDRVAASAAKPVDSLAGFYRVTGEIFGTTSGGIFVTMHPSSV